MAVTIIRAEHNKELFDLFLTLDRKNKSEMKYWAGLHGFTGSGTWFVLSCQEIGDKELVLVCTGQP